MVQTRNESGKSLMVKKFKKTAALSFRSKIRDRFSWETGCGWHRGGNPWWKRDRDWWWKHPEPEDNWDYVIAQQFNRSVHQEVWRESNCNWSVLSPNWNLSEGHLSWAISCPVRRSPNLTPVARPWSSLFAWLCDQSTNYHVCNSLLATNIRVHSKIAGTKLVLVIQLTCYHFF